MKLLKIETKIDIILMIVSDDYDKYEVLARCYNANDNVSNPYITQEIDIDSIKLNIPPFEPYFGNKYKDTEFE